jgi:hypothetical protein
MPWVFNPFTGKLDQTAAAGGGSQVNSDWNSTSGVSQILNKPTIPAAQVNADWNATSGVSQILNKPTIPAATTDASLLTSGTLADARLSSNVVTLTGTQTLTNKSIDAAQLTGTLADARLSSNVSLDNINNNFTVGQTITAPANTSALTAGYSVTGANTTPLVSLTGTWNTTGVARGILLNITDTASAATSALMDLGVGSRTQYAFTKSRQFWLYNSSPATQDASNFERGFMRWNSNSLEIGTESGGTGSIRQVRLFAGSSNPITFNAASASSVIDISGARSLTFASGLGISPNNTPTISGLTFTNYATGAADPTTTTLTNGNWQVYRNTTSGIIRLWANNNGTMVSVALA